jgi:hypothetical protein
MIPEIKNSIRKTNDAWHPYFPYITHLSDEFHKDIAEGRGVGIYSGTPFFTSSDLTYIKKFIAPYANKNQLIFFDGSFEGFGTALIKQIHEIISEAGVAPSQCFYYTCAYDINDFYQNFCEKNNITDRINIRITNTFEHSMVSGPHLPEPEFKIRNKKKLFLCFNRINRKHRLMLLALLWEKGLVSRSFYSFFMLTYAGPSDVVAILNQVLCDVTPALARQIEKTVHLIAPHLPLTLNVEKPSINQVTLLDSDFDYIDESYFSLVTETFFFPYNMGEFLEMNSRFFSEKTFKPILSKHPFILASRPHSLLALREMGYKTFSPFIDESYDAIDNDEERLLAIVQEIKRLSRLTKKQWIEWCQNVAPIVEHNYSVIKSDRKYIIERR